MLILTRRVHEGVQIGDALVRILQIKGQVTLGIEAPDDVNIVRTELLQRQTAPPTGPGPSSPPPVTPAARPKFPTLGG
jgi:carbon storage regulator CsrA